MLRPIARGDVSLPARRPGSIEPAFSAVCAAIMNESHTLLMSSSVQSADNALCRITWDFMNDLATSSHALFSHMINICFPFFLGVLPSNAEEKRHRVEEQSRDSKWHQFVDGELILKQGLIDKRKGLFARRRMLLLTTGPRLFYVDPANMVLKGEIPWSPELRVEAKNFKIFLVHTVSCSL